MIGMMLVFAACTGQPLDDTSVVETGDFEADLVMEDDIPTVGWARWTTDAPGTSWVEFGPTLSLGSSTPPSTTPSTEHAVLVAGLAPNATWYWRAASEVDGEVLRSAVRTVETGVSPRDLPRLTLGEYDASLQAPGYTLTTSLGDPSWVIIYNGDGEPVWWQQAPSDRVVAQARLTDNGTAVVYNVASLNFGTDVGQILRVRLDGDILSETRTVMGHHDFLELEDGGGFAYIAADTRAWVNPADGLTYDVVGDAIYELPEGATEDTERTLVWDTWDDIPVDVDPLVDNDFYPFGLDWTHCNGLATDGAGGYVVSVRKENAFVKIDRATGETLWQLGGAGTEFTQTEGRPFIGQHSPDLTDGGVLLFDNGDPEADDAYSEAVEYAVDEDGRTYTPIWTYNYDKRISSYLLGDVERLSNGNTLVAWGSGGVITEVTPAGDVAFQVSLAIGSAVGFTHHVDALGGVLP